MWLASYIHSMRSASGINHLPGNHMTLNCPLHVTYAKGIDMLNKKHPRCTKNEAKSEVPVSFLFMQSTKKCDI